MTAAPPTADSTGSPGTDRPHRAAQFHGGQPKGVGQKCCPFPLFTLQVSLRPVRVPCTSVPGVPPSGAGTVGSAPPYLEYIRGYALQFANTLVLLRSRCFPQRLRAPCSVWSCSCSVRRGNWSSLPSGAGERHSTAFWLRRRR